MKNIAFIGIGVMGGPMARNLMKAGYALAVYTRTAASAAKLADEGARLCGSIAACVAGCDAVITMVGYPRDVEEVYFGEGGILQTAPAGAYLIDMTTTDPAISARIYEAASAGGRHALDAPVSGGDTGARNATLSIMAGGDEADFNACKPLFDAMGKTVLHVGGPGAGQHTKMANQIALAGAIAGVCEAIEYARGNGLDPARTLETLSQGAAASWQLSNNGPRILDSDFAPGFYIKHYIKDLRIAVGNCAGAEVTAGVLRMYEALAEQGMGDLGTQALIRYYSPPTKS